ncbi:MAG: F0F1 ATP synthase subunit A [Actinobacteria bacterium]|jgi:F-type H+-transporting ATPase subunit a|nr:F0F1 ATP synthase subunit A [Actinomycetota bacterium]MDQ3531460.1 F0F1 ATP synthase subunit A [Actinomycetota bacterium]
MELDVNELFFWDPVLLAGTPFEINRVVLLIFVASILCMGFFLIGARRVAAIPKGIGLMAEEAYMFVRNQIAIDVIGPEGIKYAPFLASLFFFIFFCNFLEIVPGINFPVTSRMAIPAFLALLSYVVFNVVGIRKQGLKYFVNTLFPPGVPLAIKPLLALIELFSVFFVRPLTLAIRLLANMMAGHVLLTIFFLFTDSFILGGDLVGLPLGILTLLVACVLIIFELLVITLQAYIFTMLTAFYISEAMHGHDEEEEHAQPQRDQSEHEAQQETEGVREAA